MIRVNVRYDHAEVERKVRSRTEKMQLALDQQVLKDSNYFIPKDTGNLEASGMIASRPGQILWDTPYARALYWNPQYRFSTDSNPNAQGLWFEAAKALFLSDWLKILKKV